MPRMTDDDIEATIRKSREGPWKNYRSYRAIESEARRRMAQEIIVEARGMTVIEMFEMIERKAKGEQDATNDG